MAHWVQHKITQEHEPLTFGELYDWVIGLNLEEMGNALVMCTDNDGEILIPYSIQAETTK